MIGIKVKTRKLMRALAVLGIIALSVCVLSLSAFADGEAKIKASSAVAEKSSTVAVSFNLEGNPGIWGLKLRVTYNHSALTLKNVTAGSVFTADELTCSEDYSKDPYVIVASGNQLKNKTGDGTVVTMSFEVSSSAEYTSYPITFEITGANNTDGQNISVSAESGAVNVVECVHNNKEWKVEKNVTCDTDGKEVLTCTKCQTTFDTRDVPALKHKNTRVEGAVAATTEKEGYTGDTYCRDCGILLSQGKSIAKLEIKPVETDPVETDPVETDPIETDPVETNSPDTEKDYPKITDEDTLVFVKDAPKPLVFTSSADFADFVRVEIDGKEISADKYTVASGSTVLTLSAEYLSTLEDGHHTVSVVSKSGVAISGFRVRAHAEDTTAETEPSKGTGSSVTPQKTSIVPIIIASVISVLCVIGLGVFFITQKRR